MCHTCGVEIVGITIAADVAKITAPLRKVIVNVSLFFAVINPPKSTRNESPTLNAPAGTVKVPTPPSIIVPAVVVAVTGVELPVCANKPREN